ncbi:hypothetical protein HY745_03025 [Candidatus Desantisbacteria bacterium]|nr:hypothetical protein [Candidatus Desantisbacteria bacterium]
MKKVVNKIFSALQKKSHKSVDGGDPYHNILEQFVANINSMNNPTILEIGSRNV